MTEVKQYLTRKELADRLGVKDRTIDLWRRTKDLPCIKLGYAVRFEVGAVNDWIEKQNK